jgi:hypothetical protein
VAEQLGSDVDFFAVKLRQRPVYQRDVVEARGCVRAHISAERRRDVACFPRYRFVRHDSSFPVLAG